MTKQTINQKACFVAATRNLASALELLEKAFLEKYSTKNDFDSALKIKMDKIKHGILTFIVYMFGRDTFKECIIFFKKKMRTILI